jgi:site-specific DNA-cytosine methylase
MLSSLDLFSGIGGIAVGLRRVARPVAFCEIDSLCRAILAERFQDVPILGDVKAVNGIHLDAVPQLITAGFPCQDLSVAGHRVGLEKGTRSGLVFEIFRLISELDSRKSNGVNVLFFENSPMIKRDGLTEICRRCKKLGFDRQVWVYLAASDVGAHHKRQRWFFMATRGQLKLPRDTEVRKHAFEFQDEKVPRLTKRLEGHLRRPADSFNRKRISSLGNAVVPEAVTAAWMILSDALVQGQSGEIQEQPSWLKGRQDPLDLRMGSDGYLTTRWTTPVHTTTHWFPQIGFQGRNRQMLANQVFHEHGTKKAYRYRSVERAREMYSLNPEWVEALMGFPVDWSLVTHESSLEDNP